MLSLEQIGAQYPENLQPYKRSLLREYLQYKILEIIFSSKYAGKLSFLGGTALRIVYGNSRFSEDLDFDNVAITDAEFATLSQEVRKGLESQGLSVEVDVVGQAAYRCRVRFPNILFEHQLSAHVEEKVMIQIDSVVHGFEYESDKKILNRFDVFTEIFVTPLDVLLSQKFYAALNRSRAKGRDFFDIVFLLGMTQPNYAYLKSKLDINNAQTLRARLVDTMKDWDFKELGRDVQPFLFNPADTKRVEMFLVYIQQEGILR